MAKRDGTIPDIEVFLQFPAEWLKATSLLLYRHCCLTEIHLSLEYCRFYLFVWWLEFSAHYWFLPLLEATWVSDTSEFIKWTLFCPLAGTSYIVQRCCELCSISTEVAPVQGETVYRGVSTTSAIKEIDCWWYSPHPLPIIRKITLLPYV